MLLTTVNRLFASVRASALLTTIRDKFTPSQGGFARRVIMLAGGTALGQGVTILAAPLLTRLYTPADYGILAVYASILTSILGIAALRYQLAIPIVDDDESVANLLALCLLIVGGMTAVFGLGLWLFGNALVTWTQTAELSRYLWLLPLSFLGAGMYQVLNFWAIRNNHFGALARTRFGQGAGMVLTQLGLGLLKVGPAGLLVGDAVGRAAGSLNLARVAWESHCQHRKAVSLTRMRQLASRFRRFPLISGPSSLLASVRGQLPTLLLASFYGGQVVGWFGLGQRLLTVTFFLIASSVGDVYLNESARYAREDPRRLMPFFWRTLRRSTIVMLPLLGGLALVGPWIFGPLFGSEWVEAGHYVRVLAIVSLFDFLGRSVGSTLSVLERQDLDLISDVLGIALTSGALAGGGTMGATPMMTLVLYTVAGSLAGIINLFLVWYAIRQTVNKGNTFTPTIGAGA